ncbi:hypothetical protein [Parafrankia sp. Ea1.12]|uniref:hypothetical protein n=1 Tax=Parafrankia sp. Ea1.12 TaxID=573499 RepID=UPI001F4303E2|nr:hypothetical protein [Parafrankia sp. Ea1.12]
MPSGYTSPGQAPPSGRTPSGRTPPPGYTPRPGGTPLPGVRPPDGTPPNQGAARALTPPPGWTPMPRHSTGNTPAPGGTPTDPAARHDQPGQGERGAAQRAGGAPPSGGWVPPETTVRMGTTGPQAPPPPGGVARQPTPRPAPPSGFTVGTPLPGRPAGTPPPGAGPAQTPPPQTSPPRTSPPVPSPGLPPAGRRGDDFMRVDVAGPSAAAPPPATQLPSTPPSATQAPTAHSSGAHSSGAHSPGGQSPAGQSPADQRQAPPPPAAPRSAGAPPEGRPAAAAGPAGLAGAAGAGDARRSGRGWSATGRREPRPPGRGGGAAAGSDQTALTSRAGDGRGRQGRGGRRGRQGAARNPDIHFINAFTDTIDLSSLRRRLEMEDGAAAVDQTDYIPRLYGRNRPESDAASTQVMRRSGAGTGPGQAGGRWAGPASSGSAAGAAAGEGDPVDGTARPGRARHARGGGSGTGALEVAEQRPGTGPAAAEEAVVGGGSTKAKAIWTLADQGVSSATNAAVSLLIARQVSSSEYGSFAIAYIIFSVIIGISRAGGCLPLGISYSGKSVSEFRYAAASATGACLVFGGLLGIVLVGVGAVAGGSVGSALVVVGFVLPGLLLQDAWRYVFFAMGKPLGAFLNDVAWALVQVVGLTVLIERGVTASPPMLLAWGISALVAALLGVAQAGLWPAPSRALTWVRENRANAANLAAEFVTVQGALQASMLLIGLLSSKETIGALNGVRTLLGPTTVIGVGIVSFAVPELSRRIDMSVRARERAAVLLTVIVVGVGGLWSLLFIAFPAIGETLLGDTWPGAHHILVYSAFHYAGTALPTGPACIMYALGRTKITFRINLSMAPMLFAFPILGLLLADATGAVIGYNLVFWGIAPVWWILLRRIVREHARGRPDARDAAEMSVQVGAPEQAETFEEIATSDRAERFDHTGMSDRAVLPAGNVRVVEPSGREGPGRERAQVSRLPALAPPPPSGRPSRGEAVHVRPAHGGEAHGTPARGGAGAGGAGSGGAAQEDVERTTVLQGPPPRGSSVEVSPQAGERDRNDPEPLDLLEPEQRGGADGPRGGGRNPGR